MDANNKRLLEFIGDSKRTFYIPVYQRNYDWEIPECETLFKDIEVIADSPNSGAKHFLGTIVYLEEKSHDPSFRTFTIIDGQQRVTTLMILLKVIMDSCEDKNIKGDIYESYLTNQRCDESLRIKLKPIKSDADNFDNLMNDRIEYIKESHILTNYNLFKRLVAKSKLSPEQIYQGIQRLEIVYISLDQGEDPQLIFESLNFTGQNLTSADLIRNYMLMGHEHDIQLKLYKNYWLKLEEMLSGDDISNFIRNYLTLKKNGDIPVNKSAKEIYKSFKIHTQGLINYDPVKFLEELVTYGKYYSWFEYFHSPSGEIDKRLKQLHKLKATIIYPFLLSVFAECYLFKNIDEKELCKTLDIILSYIIRRQLCDIPPNILNRLFAGFDKEIEGYNDMPLSERVATVLVNKEGRAVFPDNNMLRDQMLTRDAYKYRNIKFILEQIERSTGKEHAEFDELTIEHIMPQELSPEWVADLGENALGIQNKYLHTIGNLTLSAYNSELSNKRFSEKSKLYKTANVRMTRHLTQYSKWGENEILDRSEKMIDAIKNIWKYPDIAKVPKANTKTEFDFSDEVNVTGRKPCELQLMGEVYNVKSWDGFMKKICEVLYKYDPQRFRSLTKDADFQGRICRIIGDSTENMRNPHEIAENLYVETNLSANAILNYSKIIIEKFDGADENSSYELKAE